MPYSYMKVAQHLILKVGCRNYGYTLDDLGDIHHYNFQIHLIDIFIVYDKTRYVYNRKDAIDIEYLAWYY